MAIKDVEDVLVSRVESKLSVAAPQFDPAIITTLFAMLADLLTGACTKQDVTPEEAVSRVSKMSRIEQQVIQSRLLRKAREDGVKDAKRLVPIAVESVKAVAAEATDEERLAFASKLLPVAGESFDIF